LEKRKVPEGMDENVYEAVIFVFVVLHFNAVVFGVVIGEELGTFEGVC
jgi:hypothetical protein